MSPFIMIDLARAIDADRRRETRPAIFSRPARNRTRFAGLLSRADEPDR